MNDRELCLEQACELSRACELARVKLSGLYRTVWHCGIPLHFLKKVVS